MAYNLTFMDESNTLYDVVKGVNLASEYFYVIGFLIVLWVMIANQLEYSLSKSLMVSSFITSLVAVLFSFAELISWNVVSVPLGLFMLSLILYFFVLE
jgi:hypothetical protein